MGPPSFTGFGDPPKGLHPPGKIPAGAHVMKCIRTKQIHEYNSNIIYTLYKQHKANTKKNTHTPILPSPPPPTHIEMI